MPFWSEESLREAGFIKTPDIRMQVRFTCPYILYMSPAHDSNDVRCQSCEKVSELRSAGFIKTPDVHMQARGLPRNGRNPCLEVIDAHDCNGW